MPTPPTDLRDTILIKASDLFRTQGFAATSIKQIVGAAGCTNAALYYYFPEGKAEILREVVRASVSDVTHILAIVEQSANLEEFLQQFGYIAVRVMPQVSRNLGWLQVDFNRLEPQEQAFVQDHLRNLYEAIYAGVARFVNDAVHAQHIAWLIVCAFFGYEQIFGLLHFQHQTGPEPAVFASSLAQIVARGAA